MVLDKLVRLVIIHQYLSQQPYNLLVHINLTKQHINVLTLGQFQGVTIIAPHKVEKKLVDHLNHQ
jgi:hypothetical protein